MGNRKVDWVESYLKEVQDALVCPGKEKKRFLVDFRENVYSCFIDDPNMTEEKLRERFGSPEEISSSFVHDEDPSVVQKYLSFKRIRRFAAVSLIVLGVIAVLLLGIYVYDTYLYNHGEYILADPIEGNPPPDESAMIIY